MSASNLTCAKQLSSLQEEIFFSKSSNEVTTSSGSVTPDYPPFSYVGFGYFRPLSVQWGLSTLKRYGYIFRCLASKSTHIKMRDSLRADSFIYALRRLIRRHDKMIILISDGINFVGARNEL